MRWVLLLWLGCSACGPSASDPIGGGSGGGGSGGGSSTSAEHASSSSSTGTPPPPEGCTCAPTDDGGRDAPDCGGDELCPAIVTGCAEPVLYYGCIGQDVVYDETTLGCALDVLANRTPGSFQISLQDLSQSSCGLEGCSRDVWTIRIPDGSPNVVVSNCYHVPMTEPRCVDLVRELESPGYFEACKELPEGQAQLDCLFDGMRSGTAIACP